MTQLGKALDGGLGLSIGVGLRSSHYEHILQRRPDVAWFEVLSDNYMNTSGRPLAYLDRITQRYPVVLHGVGMSIGSVDALDLGYLRQLRALRDRTGARWVSDHIAWTGVSGRHGHDLYPVPFTEECLRHVARRVCQVQDYLDAPLVLENPSTYLQFDGAALTESQFIAALLEETGAGLLLDVNNVIVNAHNHGFDPRAYLRELPLERVVQLHVAGHGRVDALDAAGQPIQYRVDTHAGRVSDEVWALLEEAIHMGVRAPVLLEWDADIPSFPEVHAEALLAGPCIRRGLDAAAARASHPRRERMEAPAAGLRELSP